MNLKEKRADKKAKTERSRMMKKTAQLYSNCRARLRKAAAKAGISEKLELPYSLDYLRGQWELKVGSPCPYCGEFLSLKNVSLDHAIPVARREEQWPILEPFMPRQVVTTVKSCSFTVNTLPDSWARLIAAFSLPNTVFCCKRCNARKGEMLAKDYKELLQFLSLDVSKGSADYVLRQLSYRPIWKGGKA